jgi:hypothetical protein
VETGGVQLSQNADALVERLTGDEACSSDASAVPLHDAL